MTARRSTMLYVPQGGRITQPEQFEALPQGAVMTTTSDIDNPHRPNYREYTIGEGNNVTAGDGSRYSRADFYGGAYSVLSLPEGWTRPDDQPEEQPLSFEMFRQEFITAIIGGACSHGISRDPVYRALESAGLPLHPERLEPGMMLNTADEHIRNVYVEGMLIRQGWRRSLSIVGWRDRDWYEVFGRAGLGDRTYEVIHVPGIDTQWSGLTPADDDAEKIAEFKSQMWMLGSAAKRANSWCSSFEAVMLRMGIDPSSRIYGPEDPGSEVAPEQAKGMSVGTLFWYQTRPDDNGNRTWVLVVRSDERSNAAGTRRIGTTNSEFRGSVGHYRSAGMTIVWNPSKGSPEYIELSNEVFTDIPYGGTAILDALPQGSRISLGRAGAPDFYTKCSNGLWHAGRADENTHGSYNHSSFSGGWGITYIPDIFGSEQ